MDEKQLQDLIDSLKKIGGSPRDQQQKLRVEADKLVKQQKTNKELQRFVDDLKDRARKDKDARRVVQDLSNAIDDNIAQHKKYRETLQRVGSSVMGLGQAAAKGEGSISSFTDNFKQLGVIGEAFGSLGNRLDTNIETFRQLSQIGATFGQSIVELRQAAATAALPLDDFAALVANNSQNLAALFGSTTQGARGIAFLGEQVRKEGIEKLAPFGFTVDELNETLLLNLERQRRTNIFDTLTREQRVQSAIRFAEELDRLARLTGAQRDELRAQIEQQQSNAKFQAFLQNATDTTRTRLETFAASVGNIAPGLNEGFQDLIANAGVPVTESALALVQNIPQARDVVNDLIAGTINSETALSRLRDAAGASVDKFRKATVTGQVEFLALQGDVINLARRIVDVDSIFDEQGETASRLTKGLATFEDASKRISSQFQQIETGLLAGFGPALGGLSEATQFLMKGVGGLVAGIAQVPALTGAAIAGVLAGKFLFKRADQIGIIAAGTSIGMRGIGGTLTKLGIGGKGSSLGRIGGAATTGLGRALPGLGAAIGVGSSLSMMASDNEDTARAGKFGLGGAALGALAGQLLIPIPGVGALIGAGIGSMAGQAFGAREFGGGMDAGKTYLTGERGPELVTAKTSSTVTSNRDLKDTFDTGALEMKMSSMITELNSANKTLANMVTGVNTLVAVESRALKAVEKTARKDPSQIGIV